MVSLLLFSTNAVEAIERTEVIEGAVEGGLA